MYPLISNQKQLVDNACRFAVLFIDKITEEQINELNLLLDDALKVNSLHIWKYKKSMDKFEDTFKKYGGNVKALEEELIKIRNQAIELFKIKQKEKIK